MDKFLRGSADYKKNNFRGPEKIHRQVHILFWNKKTKYIKHYGFPLFCDRIRDKQ